MALGLFDYPRIIQHPMDLGLVKRNCDAGNYNSVAEAAEGSFDSIGEDGDFVNSVTEENDSEDSVISAEGPLRSRVGPDCSVSYTEQSVRLFSFEEGSVGLTLTSDLILISFFSLAEHSPLAAILFSGLTSVFIVP